MSRYLSPRLSNLQAYTPGEQPKERRYIKLNTNESPYPPPPSVLAALEERTLADLRLYCDPEGKSLREALARQYALSPAQVFLSNGSDDILNFAFWAYGQAGVAFPDISYSFYPVYAQLHGLSVAQIPLREDFTLAPEDCFAQGKLLVITNPNAPTGTTLTLCQLREILLHNREHVVLIDEAYVDFGAESAAALLPEFPNLLVVMTFSKSRSMAGARLGFALGSEELIADLDLLKFSTNPYNVNSLSLRLGEAALQAQDYVDANCQRIIKTRADTVQALDALGFETLPSQANFVFTRHPDCSGAALYTALRARGVLVRHFNKPRIQDFLRVSIGTPEEMQAFLTALKEILAG